MSDHTEDIKAYYPDAQIEERRLAWYDYSLRFCEKEEHLSHAEHLMVVSKKS